MVATLYAVRCISESIHCLQATCSMCFAAKFQITYVDLLVMQPRHCPASYLHWPQQLNSKSNDVRNFHRPFSSQCTPQNMSEAKERQELKIWGEKKPSSSGLLLDYISYSFLLSSCLLCTWNPRAPTDQGMKGWNKISCKQVWNYYLWLWQSNSALGAFPHLPQIKQVVFKISSFFCFSLLKSAKVSMITPKIRLRTIMMTMKKNNRSYITLAAKRGSCKIRILIINNPNMCAANPYNTFLAVQQQEHAAPQPLPSVSISDALQWYLRIQSIKWN